jgi:hypothetical protein
MTQELDGNDLQIFISAEVKRLAKEVWPDDVYRAGGDKLVAELEDHGRGFIISTVVGKAIIVPVEQFLHGGSQKYCRIDDRTPDAVRLRLAEVLKAMEPHIADAIRAKQLIGRRSVVVEIAPNGT